MASKFMDRPGEQILCYCADGTICVWADLNAKDTPPAWARYSHGFYQANQRLTATATISEIWVESECVAIGSAPGEKPPRWLTTPGPFAFNAGLSMSS
jgi:hypothetical protein